MTTIEPFSIELLSNQTQICVHVGQVPVPSHLIFGEFDVAYAGVFTVTEKAHVCLVPTSSIGLDLLLFIVTHQAEWSWLLAYEVSRLFGTSV